MAPSEIPPEKGAVERVSVGLSFGDGFQFGCGFVVASLLGALIVLLAVLLALLLLSLTGVGLLGDLLGGLPPSVLL